jgi:hypothetical protein
MSHQILVLSMVQGRPKQQQPHRETLKSYPSIATAQNILNVQPQPDRKIELARVISCASRYQTMFKLVKATSQIRVNSAVEGQGTH